MLLCHHRHLLLHHHQVDCASLVNAFVHSVQDYLHAFVERAQHLVAHQWAVRREARERVQ